MHIEAKIASASPKPTMAVHKFTSCDGCQLSFLNLGENLLALSQLVDIRHFAEAGPMAPDAQVDIAFVEGSISTPDDEQRIQRIRKNTKYLITFGACATAGGLQALRNINDAEQWQKSIYPSPEHIHSLDTSKPIKDYIRVDYEIWGCPPTSRQVLAAVRALLNGVAPTPEAEKVCLECKRLHYVCVMVAKGLPCMGPVTNTGCGALCPSKGRDCYGCFGPAENTNTDSIAKRFEATGLSAQHIARRFLSINNFATEFNKAGLKWREASQQDDHG
jgi:coenzyme F420-reducing hydrogenase gamma subunit